MLIHLLKFQAYIEDTFILKGAKTWAYGPQMPS